MKKELHALRGGDPEQLKLAIADLEQQLAKRNHMLFGDKSEKRSRSDEPKEEKAPHTGHGPRQQPLLRDLEQVHLLDQADQLCSSCGGSLEIWTGQHEASEEVDVVELKYVLKKHLRQKYRCPAEPNNALRDTRRGTLGPSLALRCVCGLLRCGNRKRSRALTEREAFLCFVQSSTSRGPRTPSAHQPAEDIFPAGPKRDHRLPTFLAAYPDIALDVSIDDSPMRIPASKPCAGARTNDRNRARGNLLGGSRRPHARMSRRRRGGPAQLGVNARSSGVEHSAGYASAARPNPARTLAARPVRLSSLR